MLIVDTIVKPAHARVINIWESRGNEWRMAHPIPVHNFEAPPQGWGLPYDYDQDDRRPAVVGGGMVMPEGVTE
jgi:hypothetical protein